MILFFHAEMESCESELVSENFAYTSGAELVADSSDSGEIRRRVCFFFVWMSARILLSGWISCQSDCANQALSNVLFALVVVCVQTLQY